MMPHMHGRKSGFKVLRRRLEGSAGSCSRRGVRHQLREDPMSFLAALCIIENGLHLLAVVELDLQIIQRWQSGSRRCLNPLS